MNWIYLSPHLDDAALSCGGLIWEQSHSGQSVAIWTICAGDPPAAHLSKFAQSLHERWKFPADAVSERRQEDQRACQILDASCRYLKLLDCIYRRTSPDDLISQEETGKFLYTSDASLTGPIDPSETSLVESLAHELAASLPANSNLVCPLAIGGHVDHRLTRSAAEMLSVSLWYYADFPYVVKNSHPLQSLEAGGMIPFRHKISAPALDAWQKAVAAYNSQISTFWESLEDMQTALQNYCLTFEGITLWRFQ